MIKTAITGVIGSGKSTLSAILRRQGYAVADCDAISRQIMQPGQIGYQRCIEAFGSEILTDQGQIDRAALAALVFQAEDLRLKLEAITHPLILDELNRQAQACEQPLWFAEVPLVFEADMDNQFDEIITVSAPLEMILQRLQEGRGISRAQAELRLAAQMSQEEKIRRSTCVIVNDGNLEAMERQILKWIKEKQDGTESERRIPQ